MATKQCSDEERVQIADGAMRFMQWADGKSMQIALTCAVALATRIAARLTMDESDFIDFVRSNLRQARKSRELQQAIGPFTGTLIDGERRTYLPREAGSESDPL